ncbi:ER membrane protein complex subunit 1 isoform X2 [Manduca sexta]|uniref:ER membrane protein complex subunit 1 isoform X2 n=1 Tax=Manduca sexta TaxID=7130 RepID=UPI00188E1EC3|nr:ER membrane protein complex subunit 1 isoform X2 [Manduca sexta]
MGMLSRYIKPNFLGLLKFLNSIHWFIVFFSLINLSVCIYEDQIGKFDWRQSYVGRIKFAQFDTVSTAKKLIVATEENVLAALNLKTGQVVWRHVFESASTGNIQLLHVTEKVVTVTGANPYLVRGWDASTGVLLWEWSLTLQNDEHSEFSEWWVHQGMLVHMLPVFGSHLEVTMYQLVTGQNRGSTSKLPAVWTNDGCVLSKPYYTCISGSHESQLLLSVDVTSNAVQIISEPLSKYISTNEGYLRPLDGNSIVPGFVIDDQKIMVLENNQFVPVNVAIEDKSASITITDSGSGPLVVQTWNDDAKGLSLSAHVLSSGRVVPEISISDDSLSIPEPEISTVMCTKTAREQHACRILVTGVDDASHLLQQGGRTLWTREESLANVVAVEFVDLPVSDLDAAIESEFDQKEGSIWAAFTRRIHTQLQQLQTLINALQRGETSADDDSSALVRDYFNLHKIMVLVTDVGKIFGMDNLSGEILWKMYEPNLDTENVLVFTRKSARRTPHDAYLTIVGKDEEGNGLLLNINPIRGSAQAPGALRLRAPLLQAALHHHTRALVLLYSDEQVQIIPESAAEQVKNMYMYVADKNTAKVQGYAIVYNGEVTAQKIWSLQLGGEPAGGHRIVAAVDKGSERVHSPGRVLADRSVLYKYLNPNLVLFVTEGPDPLHKDIVTATCVDAVSGVVIFSQVHRRARALPLALHTDNMMAYFYHNDKHRRTEIASLELYEGKSRWWEQGAWAAEGAGAVGGAARRVVVERRAHVVSGAARAAARTTTLRALTDVHLLLWVSSGALVEIPWAMLEARRALPGGELSPESMGPPLAPELILAPEAALSYNLTLARPRQLHVAAPDLESTTLVLATGLDLFYTRVAPSKTFDLLKDDFDYSLITMVLSGLILASYATKYFASRKMLKMAWK